MDYLPELLPTEMLDAENPEKNDTENALEVEIKEMNEPPPVEPEPEEESIFEKPQPKKPIQKLKKRRGEPRAKRKPKPKKETEVKNMVVYEEKDEQAEQEEEEEQLEEREEKIVIDPKREKKLENLKKAREARKAKAEYKKRTPKLKPAPAPEPSIQETFNTHLLPTEEEKQQMIMEREHFQFMKFMSNMEKYKNFKKGFQIAQMEDEIIEKQKKTQAKQTQAKPVQAKQTQAKQEKKPSIIESNQPFNEYSKYFG